ncbi:hypothetical protein ACM55G_06925 [Flavobacterium sp. LB3P122]|uniref:hypothetical protein n=1 Tax=Flavobacterium algoriphilum TaxID=3398738 RepID=UPI003A84A2E5
MNNYKKEQINIDTVCKYSTDGIFIVLKNYIDYEEKIYDGDGDEVNLHYRLLVVCSIMRHLTDEKLLNHTIDVLRKFDLINEIENTGIDLSSHSENDVTKIKAIYYSLTSLYKLNLKALKFPNSKNPILFDIKLKKRIIEHNLQDVLKSLRKNNVLQFEDEVNSLPINLQKRVVDKWVRSALKVGYLKDTEMFNEEIEYLTGISNHLMEPKTLSIDKKEGVPVIALLYYYNEQFISRDNAQSIANKYGYTAKNSGEGLYHDFVFYTDNANRKASGENKIKCKNRIKSQKRVVELLIDEKAKAKAMTELNILKIKLADLS